MNICMIGAGYVGLVSAACFAEFGAQVACVDRDEQKIDNLRAGKIPIYEPGLDELVGRNMREGRLTFSTETPEAVRDALVVFIAVQTPSAEDGSTELSAVEAVAREIGRALDGYKVIVTKSTVPVGTSSRVRELIRAELEARGESIDFAVASNPEFLREGAAIGDFMRPDRVVIGADNESVAAILRDLYRPLNLIDTPFVITNVATAELTKYAANLFLATKISFINEMANLCENVGADVHHLSRGIGLDNRIGPKFLHPGPGFGGSCFPKDARAAVHFAREAGSPLRIAEAVLDINRDQSQRMVDKVVAGLGGDVAGKTIGILGLSFKPETDDMRDAPSIGVVRALHRAGATLRAYDPAAMQNAAALLPELGLCGGSYEVCEDADALIILTEWNQFRMLDLARVRASMRRPLIIDMRNVYEPEQVRQAGFEYLCVGRP